VGSDQNGNKYPIAVISQDKNQVIPDEVVQLDASKSYDSDGTIVAYQWQPEAGLSDPANEKPIFISGQPGTYMYDLIVTDNNGLTSRNLAQAVIQVQYCSDWEDVISKYLNYVNALTSWDMVVNCYGEYISHGE
jgi:hypothetical protein